MYISSLWCRYVLRHLDLLRGIARNMGLCTRQGDPLLHLLFPDQHPIYRRARERLTAIDDDPSAPRTYLPRFFDGL